MHGNGQELTFKIWFRVSLFFFFWCWWFCWCQDVCIGSSNVYLWSSFNFNLVPILTKERASSFHLAPKVIQVPKSLSLVLLLFSHSVMSDSVTPWTTACQVSLFFTISQSLLKLMSIESMIPSNHPSLCHPLLLLPSVFPSIRIFSNESALLIRWPNYWNFCFNVSPSNEYSRLIFSRIDWFDLLAVQGTLKNLLQHHSSKASILQC